MLDFISNSMGLTYPVDECTLYTITTQNYLRGVQATDANGGVTFSQSATTLKQVTLQSDMVFSDA